MVWESKAVYLGELLADQLMVHSSNFKGVSLISLIFFGQRTKLSNSKKSSVQIVSFFQDKKHKYFIKTRSNVYIHPLPKCSSLNSIQQSLSLTNIRRCFGLSSNSFLPLFFASSPKGCAFLCLVAKIF